MELIWRAKGMSGLGEGRRAKNAMRCQSRMESDKERANIAEHWQIRLLNYKIDSRDGGEKVVSQVRRGK